MQMKFFRKIHPSMEDPTKNKKRVRNDTFGEK